MLKHVRKQLYINLGFVTFNICDNEILFPCLLMLNCFAQKCGSGDRDSGMGTMSTNTLSNRTRDSGAGCEILDEEKVTAKIRSRLEL